MTGTRIVISEADKVRLAGIKRKAISLNLAKMGFSSSKPANNYPKGFLPHSNMQKFKQFPDKKPILERTHLVKTVHKPDMPQTSAMGVSKHEIELTREECFCCTMDILFDGMSKTDKVSKEAAKNLLIVMENEVGNTVSLLVYNSYVRKYNALREQYFLSVVANLKAKTIKISSDIIESLEQMARTIKIEIPPESLPGRVS
ncbi:MAG: hypothetical protein PHR77_00210 [Kiritimatiellae bacterium]|nr:hypothetical protein [Kiritimatiellia bacterium]MDD5519206.1 hypothetical protein [Kiritimatiellia bacterium]